MSKITVKSYLPAYCTGYETLIFNVDDIEEIPDIKERLEDLYLSDDAIMYIPNRETWHKMGYVTKGLEEVNLPTINFSEDLIKEEIGYVVSCPSSFEVSIPDTKKIYELLFLLWETDIKIERKILKPMQIKPGVLNNDN